MYTTTITRLESGESTMKLSDAILFAEIFGISLQRFATEPVENSTSAKILQLRNEAARQEVKIFRELNAYLKQVKSLRSRISTHKTQQELREHLLGGEEKTVPESSELDGVRVGQNWLNMPLRKSWIENLFQADADYSEYIVGIEDR